MDTRIAILSIILEGTDSAAAVNALLHESAAFILGRMGLPLRNRGMNVISIVLDAPQDRINTLAGQLGRLPGVTAKAICASK